MSRHSASGASAGAGGSGNGGGDGGDGAPTASDFEVIRELGRGTFGVASLARHLPSGTLRVLKAVNLDALRGHAREQVRGREKTRLPQRAIEHDRCLHLSRRQLASSTC